MKIIKEWFFNAPWGKVALVSWGNPKGKPVLLVHGRQDSAATFIPLLEMMPDDFHYVGVDMPGNGKSDPFPSGIIVPRFLGVVVIEWTVKHLEWTEFTMIAHSLGSEQGLFYNAVHPGQIKKFVHLDVNPALQRMLQKDFKRFYSSFYEEYYNNFDKYNVDDRVYTKRQAVEAVMRNRKMTEAQAELILSRSLVQVGEDQYKLTWERRAKVMVPTDYPVDFYYDLFSKNIPPTLFVCALDSVGDYHHESKEIVEKLIADIQNSSPNVTVLKVRGHHDVHFTNPERFIGELNKFLLKDFETVKSKL